MIQILIQSLAIIAVTLFLISFHAKTRKSILLLQLVGLIIWAVHFFLLNAWTGAVLMIINGIITAIFLFKTDTKKLNNPIILLVALIIFFIVTIVTWTGFYSLLPFLGVSSITIAKWQNHPSRIRLISIPASIFWVIYDSFVGAYGSIIAEVLIILSIILSLLHNQNDTK